MSTSEQRRASLAGPIGLGVGLIIMGTAYLLDRLGVLPIEWGILWPIFPMIVGAVALITSIRNWWGWILIAVGAFFLLNELVLGGLGNIWELWPAAVIVVGIVFIVNAIRGRNRSETVGGDGAAGQVPPYGTDPESREN
ncbi:MULTISPECIES: LiaI-LiaF-like domain-containing protein [unclassified Pseudoclavibacter]|uniref:LiaI-LiaF-like domain-containing protein n=1 Tax=unclassified Pseudoclavibacter TaxID=2615177 RepID=UPI001BABB3E4|nr:DUF5668 domain-containing protein [Pseudoclavibacter sp. Marseille-Q4354]MBS3177372.1 hypothetical protein [Pseudoclavibacter sp. Marseille-Q4354]